jgi:hypothetical protein
LDENPLERHVSSPIFLLWEITKKKFWDLQNFANMVNIRKIKLRYFFRTVDWTQGFAYAR